MALATAPNPLSLPSFKPLCFFRIPKSAFFLPNSHSNLIVQAEKSDSSVSLPHELDGEGPSAPTRGEIYLQMQQSQAASAAILSGGRKKKRNKNEEKAAKAFSLTLPCCYGCGAPLQTSEPEDPGYVELETYNLKKKHKQLNKVLCRRCKLLSHGYMITAVGGHGGYSGGKQFVTAEELRQKLSHLRHDKALIVKLVDIVDFNGSFIARIRDIVGANPIILVITKVDLLPRGTDLNCIGDWVVEATMKKKLNVMSVHLTSSKSLVGVAGVISEIQKEKKGAANVGKSAFINAVLKMLSYKDPIAAAARKYKPIQSAVPGTTLGPIQIEAFPGGGKLYDTPGVHLHHRQAAVVDSGDLPALAPKSRLRGELFPNPQLLSDGSLAEQIRLHGLTGFSIFWGGLVRIDAIKLLPSTRLLFYGPKAVQLHLVPTQEADEFYKKQVGIILTPPSGQEKASSWMGLETKRELLLNYPDVERPAYDVVISGLGWISVQNGEFSGSEDVNREEEADAAIAAALVVHVPKPVEIFVRPPLPVGNAGTEWYQYKELTEMEHELRPKWYF